MISQNTPRILITGSSGLVGQALIPALEASGFGIVRMLRARDATSAAEGGGEALFWDPERSSIEAKNLEGFHAVINLSGENIAGRWTEQKKSKIRTSRVGSTRLLSEALLSLSHPPKVFVSASAVGFYGDRGDELLSEESSPGYGLLANISREWEREAERSEKAGIRVVLLRIGVVLSKKGGGLKKMLPGFRLGLGGTLGDGSQYMSWISINDLTRVIDFVIHKEFIRGPVNVVSPNPVTNKEFTRTLGEVLRRPAITAVPKFLLRGALGEFADEALLASTRVFPAKLTSAGFVFSDSDLKSALIHALR